MSVKYKAKSIELGKLFYIRWAKEVLDKDENFTMEDVYDIVAKDFGLSSHVVRSIKQGVRICPQELAEDIAKYFHREVDDLFKEHLVPKKTKK